MSLARKEAMPERSEKSKEIFEELAFLFSLFWYLFDTFPSEKKFYL